MRKQKLERPNISRRRFLQGIPLASAALLTPSLVLADPFAPYLLPQHGRPIKLEGAVRSGGKGIAGVRVTDGVTVSQTATDGTYQLVSSSLQPFVYVCMPDGYAIGKNETGTARFYQRIQPSTTGAAQNIFELTKAPSSSKHAFVSLADTQTQDSFEMGRLHDETVPDLIETIAQLGDTEVFGVACGDIMFDDLDLYPEYERAVRRTGVPFFQVIGNHDLDFDGFTDESSIRTFNRHFGPGYYSFDRGEVHYIVLDDVMWHKKGYLGYIDEKQLNWLIADLSYVEAGRPVIVFAHIPALSTASWRINQTSPAISQSITNRERLYHLLEPYDAHLLSGHTHENEHVFEGGIHEHIHGATCGAWWSGDICHDGTPNGYCVYEIDGTTIKGRYKGTGQSAEHQLRLYKAGSDPMAPTEFVANVWDAHDGWTITWYVDGEQKGRMARRNGTDLLSRKEHTGDTLPSHRPWVEPRINNHMFYAPAPAQSGHTLTVEARDPFGRTYTESLTT